MTNTNVICQRSTGMMIHHIIICALLFLLFSGCALKTSTESQNQAYECDEEADNLLMSEDLEKSIRLHEAYIKKHPENAVAFYHLGYALGQMGAKEAEIFYYKKSAALGYKKSGDLYFNLGMAQAETGNYEQAEKAFLKAVSLQPGRIGARLNLARLYIEYFREQSKAEEQLIIVLGIDPENQEALELMRHITAPE